MPAGSSGLLVEFHAQAAEPDSPVWRHTGRTAGSARGAGATVSSDGGVFQ